MDGAGKGIYKHSGARKSEADYTRRASVADPNNFCEENISELFLQPKIKRFYFGNSF